MSGAEPDCEARGTLVMEKAGVEAPPVIWGPDAESRYCMECAGASPVVWGPDPAAWALLVKVSGGSGGTGPDTCCSSGKRAPG